MNKPNKRYSALLFGKRRDRALWIFDFSFVIAAKLEKYNRLRRFPMKADFYFLFLLKHLEICFPTNIL
jgi:hypothetical protein